MHIIETAAAVNKLLKSVSNHYTENHFYEPMDLFVSVSEPFLYIVQKRKGTIAISSRYLAFLVILSDLRDIGL